MVTEKEAKSFLQGFRRATLELDSLQQEHEHIMSMLYSFNSDPSSDGGGNGPSDKVGNGVSLLIDHCRKVDDEIKQFIQSRDEVHAVIRHVMHKNIVWGQCLHHRYIRGCQPVVSAHEMGYEPGSERKIHRNAVKYVATLLARKDDDESGPPWTA